MAERILIVDDEIDMLELLELIITDRTEYEVITTNIASGSAGFVEETAS